MGLKPLQQFYLAGGTGLALQLGHRSSVDINLFTSDEFNQEELEENLIVEFADGFEKTGNNSLMYFCFIDDIKVDFINNRTPLKYNVLNEDGLRLAQVRDITPLKMKAIFQRGSKKDFIDFYALLQQFSLNELLEMFHKQFPFIDKGQLLISLTYFADAEADVMPKLFFDETWDNIKSEITKTVVDYLKS